MVRFLSAVKRIHQSVRTVPCGPSAFLTSRLRGQRDLRGGPLFAWFPRMARRFALGRVARNPATQPSDHNDERIAVQRAEACAPRRRTPAVTPKIVPMTYKHLFFLLLVLLQLPAAATTVAPPSIAVPDSGWHLWLDRDARWRDEPAYLPGDVSVDQIPARPPTG